jgi:hypothetical protein
MFIYVYGQPARKTDDLTAIYEPIIYKMWEPRRLTTLWASTACYRDSFTFYIYVYVQVDHLCGLVVRVPAYRSRGSGFDSRRYLIFWKLVGLERGPFSIVRIIEELLERTVAGPV